MLFTKVIELQQLFIARQIPEGYLPSDDQVAKAIQSGQDLLAAAELALFELDRIGSDIGFEPERYRERIMALDALSRAIRNSEIEPEKMEVIIDN